jgi:hypothetical protein
MKKSIPILLAAVSLGMPAAARAQAPSTAGPRQFEVTLIPAGALVFQKSDDAQAPNFANYELGGAFTYNINRIVGVEGEVGTSIGVSQSLDFNYPTDVRTPDLLTYSGNVVVSAPTGTSIVPYVTGGVGGLSIYSRKDFGVDSTQTLFTTNVGGGVKWYAGRWGLRADYRFLAVPSRDSVSAFGFGDSARYGHRVYGAVLLNLGE